MAILKPRRSMALSAVPHWANSGEGILRRVNTSAESRISQSVLPPASRTLPSGNRVSVCWFRPTIMLPKEVKVIVEGVSTSAAWRVREPVTRPRRGCYRPAAWRCGPICSQPWYRGSTSSGWWDRKSRLQPGIHSLRVVPPITRTCRFGKRSAL